MFSWFLFLLEVYTLSTLQNAEEKSRQILFSSQAWANFLVVTNQVFSGPEKKEFWAPVKEVKEKKTLRKGKEREDNISKIKRNKRKERKENVKQAIGKGKRKESWSELNGNYSVDKQP